MCKPLLKARVFSPPLSHSISPTFPWGRAFPGRDRGLSPYSVCGLDRAQTAKDPHGWGKSLLSLLCVPNFRDERAERSMARGRLGEKGLRPPSTHGKIDTRKKGEITGVFWGAERKFAEKRRLSLCGIVDTQTQFWESLLINLLTFLCVVFSPFCVRFGFPYILKQSLLGIFLALTNAPFAAKNQLRRQAKIQDRQPKNRLFKKTRTAKISLTLTSIQFLLPNYFFFFFAISKDFVFHP